MYCYRCHKATGSLDCPIRWRSLGDWLENEDIKPLCQACFNLLKITAVQDIK